jgi:hypothetical protein
MVEDVQNNNNKNCTFTEEEASRTGAELSLFDFQKGTAQHVHFTTRELINFAEQRKKLMETWQIPEELARCNICLNSFEALLGAEQENIVPEVIAKIEVKLPIKKMLKYSFVKYIVRLAAGFLIIASIWYGLTREWNKAYPAFTEGMLSDTNGQIFTAGTKLPAKRLLSTAGKCAAEYIDGSKISFDAGSLFEFQHTFTGGKVLALLDGGISAEVKKQSFWHAFMVKTELGSVKVVGTKFNIKISRTALVVFEKAGNDILPKQSDKINAITVFVKEGIVAVSNGRKTVKVGAGSQAIIYHDKEDIELASGR